MDNILDAGEFLEDAFVMFGGLGPILIPANLKRGGISLERFTDLVAMRVRDVWPPSAKKPRSTVLLRVFSWEAERPKIGDGFPSALDLAEAAATGIIRGGVIGNRNQIIGMWVLRDQYRNLPLDMVTIQLVWGLDHYVD